MKPCLFTLHIYPDEGPWTFYVTLHDAVGVTHGKGCKRLSDLPAVVEHLVDAGVERVTGGAKDKVRKSTWISESPDEPRQG